MGDRGWGRTGLYVVVWHVSPCGWLEFLQLVHLLSAVILYKGSTRCAPFFFFPYLSLAFFAMCRVCSFASLPRWIAWAVMAKRGKGAAEAAEEVSYTNELGLLEATDRFFATLVVDKRLPSLEGVRSPGPEVMSTPHEDKAVAFSTFFDVALCIPSVSCGGGVGYIPCGARPVDAELYHPLEYLLVGDVVARHGGKWAVVHIPPLLQAEEEEEEEGHQHMNFRSVNFQVKSSQQQ